jgi:hypothetical protein
MEVEHSGFYKTRGGDFAEVIINREGKPPVVGYIVGFFNGYWTLEGLWIDGEKSGLDLIEYLGKERPKQRKTVKMAPALCQSVTGTRWLTDTIYASETQAKDDNAKSFVRWLIDTPYEISVEAEE